MTSAGSFGTKVLVTFVARGVTTLSGVILMIAAARWLGPQGKGEYAYLLTIVALGTQFGSLGIGTANLYYSSRDPASIGKLLLTSAAAAALAGMIYLVLLTLGSIGGSRLVPFTWTDIVLITFAVAVGLVWMHGQNLLVGIGEVLRYNAYAISYSLLTLAGTLAAFWFLPGSVSAIAGALLLSGGVVVAILVAHVARARTARIELDLELSAKLVRYGLTVYVAHVISFLLMKVDLLLVQYYLDSYDLGLYSAAGDFSQTIVQLQAVINMLLFPKLAAMSTEHDRRRATTRVLKTALFAYGILVGVLVAGAEPLVDVIFGSEFVPTAVVMVWLLPAGAALAIASILQNHIGAAGRPSDMALAPALALLVQLLLCVLLIPAYGISGAAIASCASFTVMAAVAGLKAFRA